MTALNHNTETGSVELIEIPTETKYVVMRVSEDAAWEVIDYAGQELKNENENSQRHQG